MVDDKDLSIRCKLIRADYDPSGGEAFLTWRKGLGCATYHFGVRAEVQCLLRVGGRVLGQAKGVAWFHDVKVSQVLGDKRCQCLQKSARFAFDARGCSIDEVFGGVRLIQS